MEINKALASKRMARMQLTESDIGMFVQMISMREADYTDVTRKWNTKWHKHSFFELHAAKTGSCVYCFENEAPYLLKANEVLLIRPETLHQVVNRTPDFVKGTAAFHLPAAMQRSRDAQKIYALLTEKPYQVLSDSQAFFGTLDRILQEAYFQEIGYHLVISQLCQQMVIDIARKAAGFGSVRSQEQEAPSQDPRARLIHKYIEDNIAFRITNTDLAAHIHVSTKQLDRIVLQEYACTPQQLIASMKCEKAKEWMHSCSDMSVAEIAAQLGFSSEYSFGRCFKRVEGMPPGMYRRHF